MFVGKLLAYTNRIKIYDKDKKSHMSWGQVSFFLEEESAFANKYNYLYVNFCNFDSRAVYDALSREMQKFQRLLTILNIKGKYRDISFEMYNSN